MMTVALPMYVALVGCNDDGGAVGVGAETTGSDTMTSADGETALAAYPSAPYGKTVGTTIADLGFYSPWDDRVIALAELYQSPDVGLLMLFSSPAWCVPCQNDQKKLFSIYQSHRPSDGAKGLEIMTALSEDTSGLPLYDTPSRQAADDGLVEDYRTSLEIPWQTLGDPGFQLGPYYPLEGRPLIMLITTADMQIVYLRVGFDLDELTAEITARLP